MSTISNKSHSKIEVVSSTDEDSLPKETFAIISKSEVDSSFSIPIDVNSQEGQTNAAASPAKGGKPQRCKQKYSKEEIAELKASVEPKLFEWLAQKRHHRYTLTCSKVAREIGVQKNDLSLYFKYVVSTGIHLWLNKEKIYDAIESLTFYAYPDFTKITKELGFIDINSFTSAFENTQGMPPKLYREKRLAKILSGDDILSPKINAIIDKVNKAFQLWVDAANYHRPLYFENAASQIAKQMHVQLSELALYCELILKEDIISRVHSLRIDEALRLIKNAPKVDLTRVAQRVGYVSPIALCDVYKEKTGESLVDIINHSRSLANHNQTDSSIRIAPIHPFDDEDVNKWKKGKGYCKPGLSLHTVAHECGFADNRFVQYLKQVEGSTFNEWISKLRFEEAKRILVDNASLSTEQVGIRVGVSSKAAFRTWFKQQSGYSPDEWRSNVLSRKISRTAADVRSKMAIPTTVRHSIEEWLDGKGYCQQRLTIRSVAKDLGITEDQLSFFFYNEGFRQFPVWISQLRINEAQHLLYNYPNLQIIDIAYRVGMTDVKVFRGVFKKIVGILPTEWREQNRNRTAAEVIASIDKKSTKPFALNLEKLHEIESATSRAQGILSNIFVDDENNVNRDGNRKAEDIAIALIPVILERPIWTRVDFDNLCASHSILSGFALEKINDFSFEKVDDVLIDDEGEMLYVNLDYKESII